MCLSQWKIESNARRKTGIKKGGLFKVTKDFSKA